MSDDQEIKPKPVAQFPPAPPTPPAAASLPPPPSAGPRAGTAPATPPAPAAAPIEYALPARKTFIPSPALIKNIGLLIKVVIALTVLLGMGYFALVALNPKARQWATQGAKDGSGGPTPFKALNQVLAIPAQAMAKTDDVVKANNARVGQLDGLVAEEDAKAAGKAGRSGRPVVDPFASPAAAPNAKPGAAAATPNAEGQPQTVSTAALLAFAEKQAAEAKAGTPTTPTPPLPAPKVTVAPEAGAPAQIKLAGDIIIAPASPAGSPPPSATFFYWIVNLNISGITQGKPARVLINGRLVYEGDEVNRTLGVVFVQLDSANKLLVFRDKTGAVVTRSF